MLENHGAGSPLSRDEPNKICVDMTTNNIDGELAISNLQRRILEGPQYLDHLVAATEDNHTAIRYLGKDASVLELTYEQLHVISQNLAYQITQYLYITHHNTVIPVLLPQHPALYVSYLAILKCGAAFCPVLPETPEERLQFILQDINALVGVCAPTQKEQLETLAPHIRWIPVDWQSLSKSRARQEVSVRGKELIRNPYDVAYVMYTSGSTGKPKGVLISHHAVTQSILAHDEHIPSFNRFLQFAAPTFDVSVFEVFFPLFRGFTLVCCEREQLLTDLISVVQTLEVDACELTPTVARTLLRDRSSVPNLKVLLTIGEMLNAQTIRNFGGDDCRGSILFAMYGPTEAAIHCTIVPRMSATSSVCNIGKPLSTVTCFILRESENTDTIIAHRGEIGELGIAGQLSDGYLNRPQETQASFIELAGYGRIYKTGDRAMLALNGDLHIYGRMSQGQVKVRGQRIELGEIEQAAYRHEGIELAVSLVTNDNIVLFCSGDKQLNSSDIRLACKSWLPRHMMPSDIVVMHEGLPLLPSGKVDRNLLKQIYMDRHSSVDSECNSTTEATEIYICELLSKELGLKISINSALSRSGLDSLRAIRISSKLRQRYDKITISDVLEAETAQDLAYLLDESGLTHDTAQPVKHHFEIACWPELVASARGEIAKVQPSTEVVEILPCSSIQLAMLAETLIESESNFNTIVLRLKDGLATEDFITAFSKLAEHNPILRTGFLASTSARIPFLQIVKKAAAYNTHYSLLDPIYIRRSETGGSVIVTIHHALYDGWSWDLIMHDLNSILGGSEPVLRPLFQTYTAQQRVGNVDTIQAQLSIWVDDLKDFEATSFPVLRSDQITAPNRIQHCSVFDLTLTDLTAVATIERVSKPSIVHAALMLQLSHLLDSTTVMTGLVLAGRDHTFTNVEEIIGPCLTTMPLLTEVKSLSTVHQILHQVHKQHLRCLRLSTVSLAQIKSALKHESPLFDVIFVWQESLYSGTPLDMVQIVSSKDNLKYALVVEIEPVSDQLYLKTTYDTSKLEHQSIHVLHEQFNAILNNMISDTAQSTEKALGTLDDSLLSLTTCDSEGETISSLTSTVADLATKDPHRTAVEFFTQSRSYSDPYHRVSITYRQLHIQSRQIAKSFRFRYSLKQNQVVAFWCEKSIDVYIAICAAVQAGVAYSCIDIRVPASRVTEVLKQSNAQLLVLDDSAAYSAGADACIQTVDLLELCKQSRELDLTVPDHEFASSPNDLAYAVFTSGSTGVPKGVLVERQNLASNIQALADIYPHRRSSKLLQSCSLAFDVSVFELFWTWHCGLTLCAATNDLLFQDIASFINLNGITHLSMTPSVAALITPDSVPGVEFLVCSGEPMSQKVFATWIDHGLHQGYGPSETTNICNVRHYRNERTHINNVGPAFASTSLYVCKRLSHSRTSRALDESDFRPLLKGGIGEVWIGGSQVGRGYTDDVLTRRSWLDHPGLGRLYRSGDIGKLLADDSLVILGREDDQAKLRGLRIELNEINVHLMQAPEVHDCYTTILLDGCTREKLVSFWVTTSDSHRYESSIPVLYDYLSERLPSYMIPEALVPVPALPITRQGKIDKPSLRDYYKSLSASDREQFSNSRKSNREDMIETKQQMDIKETLSSLAGVSPDSINNDASFFTYGIDSIQAISFVQALHVRGMTNLKISDILKYSSVHRLALFIEQRAPSTNGHREIESQNVLSSILCENFRTFLQSTDLHVQKILPCSPLQQAMLSSYSCSEGMKYVNRLTYRLGKLRHQIKAAWSATVRRHEMLRTVFASTEDRRYPFIQGVIADYEPQWTHGSVTPHTPVLEPFRSPPYVLHIQKTPEDEFLLHLFIHHALYDAEAMNVVQLEIQAYYYGTSLLPSISFSKYLDYTLDNDSVVVERFWQRKLNHMIPTRFARSANNDTISVVKQTSTITYSQLLACAGRASTTTLALVQVTLFRLLFRIFDRRDVCFGTVYSGRNTGIADIERVVGPCFNTLPTRIHADEGTTLIDTCRVLQDFNADVLAFQGTALRDLQRTYSPDGQRLFDVILLLQKSLDPLDHELWTLQSESGQMDFPLIFEIQPNQELDTVEVSVHGSFAQGEYLDVLLREFLRSLGWTIHLSASDAFNDRSFSIDGSSYLPIDPIHKNFTNLTGTTKRWSEHTTGNAGIDEVMVQNIDAPDLVVRAVKELSRLDLRHIHANSTIFQLGLDSISAAQLAQRLKNVGVEITTADILEHLTIGRIVEHCDRSIGGNLPSHSLPTHGVIAAFEMKHRDYILRKRRCSTCDIEAVWPCTSAQLGILLEHSKSGGALYQNSIRLELHQETSKDRLVNAWSKVVGRHIMLRTVFEEVDDRSSPFAMVVYAADASTSEPQNWLRPRHAKDDSTSQPNSLPWSLRYFEDQSSRYFELSILHALYDAQSLHIILDEVASIYQGEEFSPTVDIHDTLEQILVGNRDSIKHDSLYTELKEVVEATRFPDLNIESQVPSMLRVCTSQLNISINEMRGRCEALSCTIATACEAAWARILASYTGQQNVLFGAVVSSRSIGSTSAGVVFPCLNTLPVVAETGLDTTDLLRRLSELNVEIYKNVHIAASSIQQHLALGEVPFDTVFAFQQFATSNTPTELWSVTDSASAEYSVSIELIPGNKFLTVQITFNQNRLPFEHASILLAQYENILYEILGLKISQTGEMISSIRPRCALIPSEHTGLHNMFLASLARNPSKIALEYVSSFEDDTPVKQTWSYSEVAVRAAEVARCINESNGDGSLVAICFEKCPEASIAILGVLFSGCAYVAIDPGAPASRQRFILEDAGCTILLTMANIVDAHSHSVKLTVINLDDLLTKDIQSPILRDIVRSVQRHQVCYCLYTSGTTGTPKGCLISHGSAVQAMLAFSRIFEGHWQTDSRWLQFAAYHFDVSILEHFWTWSEGLCVTIAPHDLLFEDLPANIDRLGITHLDLTPSLARMLHPRDVPSLCKGVFIVGGEQVSQDIIDTWGDSHCLYNFYGPSEVTIGCTVRPRVSRNIKATNIGCTWDNVGAHVLQFRSQNVVLKGGIGELCLSGPLVGIGYLNRPELTTERFVKFKNERIYRTGDLVRMLYDGSFEFLGRIDDQVKLRGQRLEIGEVNSVLKRGSKNFADAMTLVLSHPEQEKDIIVGFLAFERSRRITSGISVMEAKEHTVQALQAVRNYAVANLPGYMVPTYILPIDSLPLTPNNKVNQKALKNFYRSLSLQAVRNYQQHEQNINAESDELLSCMRVICECLEIEMQEVSADVSLIQLGVDSIGAIRLARQLRARGYSSATVANLMRYPRVDDLCRNLCKKASDLASGVHGSVDAARHAIACFADKYRSQIEQSFLSEIERIAPCTALQQGMISHVMSSESPQPPYLTQWVFSIDVMADLERLSNAWTLAAERYDILRTAFLATEDGYAQVVLDHPKLPIQSQSNRTTGLAMTLEANFHEWIQSVRHLEVCLPWSVHLQYDCESGSKTMRLYMFHGLYDGISLPLLLRTIQSLYHNPAARSDAVPSFHEALPYGPLALRDETTRKFWRTSLEKIQPIGVNPKNNWSDNSNSTMSTWRACVPDVESVCNTLSVTAQAVFLALWLNTLARVFLLNPTIGIVFSGRLTELQNVDKVIGPLFNTLPIMVSTPESKGTLADLVKACHEKLADMLPYQHTPLSEIRRSIASMRTNELFDSLFVYQGKAEVEEHEEAQLWIEKYSTSNTELPLNFEIEPFDGQSYQFKLATKDDSFTKSTIDLLIHTFKEALDNVAQANRTFLPHVLGTRPQAKSRTDSDSMISGDIGAAQLDTLEARAIRNVLASFADVGALLGDHSPNIFELGLDSLDAIKVATRLRRHGIQLTVSQILRHPTVAGMADQWSIKRQEIDSSDNLVDANWRLLLAKTGVGCEKFDVILPVTRMQEGLILDFQQYFNTLTYRVADGVILGDLFAALNSAVIDLPVLRTRFFEAVGVDSEISYIQGVAKDDADMRSDLIQIVNISDMEDLRKYIVRLKSASTSISQPARISVLHLNSGTIHLCLALSHALYDGWSLQLMLHRIERSYKGRQSSKPLAKELIEFVEKSRQASADTRSIGFWSRSLTGIRPSILSGEMSSATTVFEQLGSQIPLEEIRTFCKGLGVTLQSVALTVWHLALIHYLRKYDVNFGLVVSGRDSEETENLEFPTFNTVIFRLGQSGKLEKDELLRKVHALTVDIYEHQHFPLSKSLAIARDGQDTVFNSLFTFQKTPKLGDDAGKILEAVDLNGSRPPPPYPVNVEAEEQDASLLWTIASQQGLMSVEEAIEILHTLDAILKYLVNDDKTTIFLDNDSGVEVCGLPPVTICKNETQPTLPSHSKANGFSLTEEFSEHETAVREVLAQASGTDVNDISLDTSIFGLGLDSISAIRLSRVLREKQLSMPVSRLLREQTVRNIAASVEVLTDMRVSERRASHSQLLSDELNTRIMDKLNENDIPEEDIVSILPALGGQVYMLDMWRASAEQLMYGTFWLKIEDCNKDRFEKAFAKLIETTPILRSQFFLHDGRYYQIVSKASSQHTGPIQYRCMQEKRSLIFTMHIHHALYDAVSLSLMLQRLQRLYAIPEDVGSDESDIRPFLRTTITSNAGAAQAFWKSYLCNVKILELPGEFNSPRRMLYESKIISTNTIKQRLQRAGVSTQALFFAAIGRVYAALGSARSSSGDGQVAVGIYLGNRSLDIEGIDNLVAPTFNVVPLKVDVSDGISLIHAAKQIQTDLQRVSQEERCGRSLRDIYQWTGIKVNCIVNFLRLPEARDTTGVLSDAERFEETTSILHASGEARDLARQMEDFDRQSPLIEKAGVKEDALEWCLPTLDVEAKVADDGGLAVGMFAPEGMADAARLQKMMDDLRDLLIGLQS